MKKNNQLEKIVAGIIEKEKDPEVKLLLTEIVRQIGALWDKLDTTTKTAEKSLNLAQHADRGYVEVSSMINGLADKFSDLKNDLKEEVEKIVIEQKKERQEFKNDLKIIKDDQKNNFRWLIGIFVTVLIGLAGIIATLV
jgi:Fic family protein